ncbi:MAG: SlyX protein [Haliea sp.]|uniref:SlyX family protein n=1 Tax=Haliea sp. TaxID=1932666 RepID=UPI000C3BAF64|nr:SlyX family protein [Haliea sp.]MBM68411.1 SlyX protein [Haliea sp.]
MKKKELLQMVEDLQSQVAFQEDALQALQAALTGQQQDLLVLRRQLQLLKERQDEQAAALDDARPEGREAPPHY